MYYPMIQAEGGNCFINLWVCVLSYFLSSSHNKLLFLPLKNLNNTAITQINCYFIILKTILKSRLSCVALLQQSRVTLICPFSHVQPSNSITPNCHNNLLEISIRYFSGKSTHKLVLRLKQCIGSAYNALHSNYFVCLYQ